MPRPTQDLSGMRTGRLTVLRFEGRFSPTPSSKVRLPYFLCQCDCGKEVRLRADLLKRPKRGTKSCGCLKVDNMKDMQAKAHEARRKPKGVAALNNFYYQRKYIATRRGIGFSLTKEEVADLISQPCAYCGDPPVYRYHPERTNGGLEYNGMDRRDNSQGYTMENTVTCCWRCNRAKGNDTFEQFKAWAERIHAHLCDDRCHAFAFNEAVTNAVDR